MIVGLTGGIGSGKTTVAKAFKELGVPIYISDLEAKNLMHNSASVKSKIITLFGEQAYNNDKLNRPFISEKIFNNKPLLKQMNAIVHPEVAKHFKNWASLQKYSYVIKESAILFESGAYLDCDAIISVIVPEAIRINRVVARDGKTKSEIKSIIKSQWTDAARTDKSDYIIVNTDLQETYRQVEQIHTELVIKSRI